MKREISFGKINYYLNRAGRQNEVTIDIELKETTKGVVFSASGNIWNNLHTDIVCGGQIFEELKNRPIGKRPLMKEIIDLWENYHLNDLHAGCEHQRNLGWEKDGYAKHPSESCPICGYKFGTEWKYSPIPENDLIRIKNLFTNYLKI